MSLLMRRRMLIANSEQGLLPSAYQQVEYIESTGTQYIDTGFIPSSLAKLETTFQFTIDYSTQNEIHFSGITLGNGRFAFGHNPKINAGKFACSIGDTNFDMRVKMDTNKHSIELDGSGYFRIDALSHTYTSTIFEGTYTIPIFVAYSKNGLAYFCHMKLYEYKLYEENVLVRNFIPCYRKSDNVIGLYDLVNDMFYTNKGTGTFLKGADI